MLFCVGVFCPCLWMFPDCELLQHPFQDIWSKKKTQRVHHCAIPWIPRSLASLPSSLYLSAAIDVCFIDKGQSFKLYLMGEVRKSIFTASSQMQKSHLWSFYLMTLRQSFYFAVENDNNGISKCAVGVKCRRDCHSLRTLHEARTWVSSY